MYTYIYIHITLFVDLSFLFSKELYQTSQIYDNLGSLHIVSTHSSNSRLFWKRALFL